MVVSTDGYGVSMLRKVGFEITKFSNFKNPFGKALNDEEFKERNSFTDKGMTACTFICRFRHVIREINVQVYIH